MDLGAEGEVGVIQTKGARKFKNSHNIHQSMEVLVPNASGMVYLMWPAVHMFLDLFPTVFPKNLGPP